LPVPGWEDIFEVNRLGQVCSLPRRVPRGGGWYRVRGGILTEQVINGHRAVYLKSCGRRETVYVEVLLRDVRARRYLCPSPACRFLALTLAAASRRGHAGSWR
jgi:hypothetical protein